MSVPPGRKDSPTLLPVIWSNTFLPGRGRKWTGGAPTQRRPVNLAAGNCPGSYGQASLPRRRSSPPSRICLSRRHPIFADLINVLYRNPDQPAHMHHRDPPQENIAAPGRGFPPCSSRRIIHRQKLTRSFRQGRLGGDRDRLKKSMSFRQWFIPTSCCLFFFHVSLHY